MSAVNQNLVEIHAELSLFCVFDRPKSHWFTVGVSVGSEHAPPPTGSNGLGSGQAVGGTAGEILHLVRSGRASTRGELAAMTGLARSTIAQRVDALLAHRILVPWGR